MRSPVPTTASRPEPARSPWRSLLAVVFALALVAAGACGADDDELTIDADGFASSVERSSGHDTGRFETVVSMDMGMFEMEVTSEGRWAGDVMEERVDLSTMLEDMFGSMGQAFDPADADEVTSGLDDLGELVTITTPDAVFLSMGGMEAFVPGIGADDEWLRIAFDDLEELAADDGIDDLIGMGGAVENDPGAMLDMLRGVGVDVHEDGTDEVRGISTTVFTGEFTLQQALEAQVDEDARDAIELPDAEETSDFLELMDGLQQDVGAVERFEEVGEPIGR